MGQLYSGNLSAFMAAKSRLVNLGCKVYISTWYDNSSTSEVMEIILYMPGGDCELGRNRMAQGDIDVLYNMATGWMNRLAKQLEYWK